MKLTENVRKMGNATKFSNQLKIMKNSILPKWIKWDKEKGLYIIDV